MSGLTFDQRSDLEAKVTHTCRLHDYDTLVGAITTALLSITNEAIYRGWCDDYDRWAVATNQQIGFDLVPLRPPKIAEVQVVMTFKIDRDWSSENLCQVLERALNEQAGEYDSTITDCNVDLEVNRGEC